MVFDAVIGNTDRHHENWGLKLRLGTGPHAFVMSIAPSFDHASSLGRECLDERAAKLLHDHRVPQYINAGRGGVYWEPSGNKGANPLALVKLAAEKYPRYFAPALAKICTLTEDDVRQMISRIPTNLASDVSKRLALAIVVYSLFELKRIQT